MKRKISDENLDLIIGKIINDSLLSKELIYEIADSPSLWRSVRKNINAEKENRNTSRFYFWHWRIAAFASLLLVSCIGLFWLIGWDKNNLSAIRISSEKVPVETFDSAANPKTEEAKFTGSETISKRAATKQISAKGVLKPDNLPGEKKTKPALKRSTPRSVPKKEEIKTEFIALAYSPIPESGQILKVKVPRSMMSALGVEANVEKSSELVNAEIIVGDDGLTRAIRFVQ